MKELVLDLVACYEERLSSVEAMMSGACAAPTLDASLTRVAEDRARLKTSLEEILARNCSLRRKDFNTLIERVISNFETKKREIDEEHRRVSEALQGYVEEQNQLVSSLRRCLVDFTEDQTDGEGLGATVARVKGVCEDKGQEVFALLGAFQLRLDAFRREQQETNEDLQRLVERGRSLRLEDLRQLEAASSGQERRAEREARRQGVERLLAHFKEQRVGNQRGDRRSEH